MIVVYRVTVSLIVIVCLLLMPNSKIYYNTVSTSGHANYQYDNVYSSFVRICSTYPHQVALSCGDVSISYRELKVKVDSLAYQLSVDFNLSDGAKVIVLLDPSVEAVVSFLALLKTAYVYVPVTPDLPTDRIDYIIDDCNASLIITKGIFSSKLTHSDGIPIIEIENVNLGFRTIASLARSNPNNPAYIIYTSGSTGRAKGVVLNELGITNMSKSLIARIGVEGPSKAILISSLSFDASILEILVALLSGCTLFIPEKSIKMNPLLMASYIKQNGIKLGLFTPKYLDLLSNDSLSGMDVIISGGDNANPIKAIDLYQRGVRFYNAYGPTECSVCATIHEYSPSQGKGDVPIGLPIDNCEVYVLNDQLKEVPFGEIGEIYISGICLALGYLNNLQKTEESFVPHFKYPAYKMYRTGDLGKRDCDNNIMFLGRADRQVKVNGNRVELSEIESCLYEYSDEILQAVAVFVSDTQDIHLYFTSHKQIIDINEIRAQLKNKLPNYMTPKTINKVSHIPLTTSLKVDCVSLLADNGKELKLVESSDIKSWLILSIQNLLNVSDVKNSDNFFEVGGDSIRIMKLIKAVYERYQVNLEFVEIYNSKDIGEIGNLIVSALEGERGESDNIVQNQNFGYALTPTQETIYKLYKPQLNRDFYFQISVSGCNCIDDIVSAIKGVASKYEVLRTTYFTRDDRLMQRVSEELNPVVVLDYDQYKERKVELVNSRFKLDEDHTISYYLSKRESSEYEILCLSNHLFLDGLSIIIYFEAFCDALFAENKVNKLNYQFKDFCALKHQSDIYNENTQYWHAKLSSTVSSEYNLKAGESRVPISIDNCSFVYYIEEIDKIINALQFVSYSKFSFFLGLFYAALINETLLKRINVVFEFSGRGDFSSFNQIGQLSKNLLISLGYDGYVPSLYEVLNDVHVDVLESIEHFDANVHSSGVNDFKYLRYSYLDKKAMVASRSNGEVRAKLIIDSVSSSNKSLPDVPVIECNIMELNRVCVVKLNFTNSYSRDDQNRIEYNFTRMLDRLISNSEIVLKKIDRIVQG